MKITPYTPIPALRKMVRHTYWSQAIAALLSAFDLQVAYFCVTQIIDGWAAHGTLALISQTMFALSVLMNLIAAKTCCQWFVAAAAARTAIRHLIAIKEKAGLR